MERYNSFNIIHKGLRAALYQTALQLQQTDFTEEDAAEEALNKVREIVMLFEGHAHKEDHFILPMIAEYEPSVVATFNSEHEEDEKLGKELNNTVERVLSSTTLLEKLVSGRELTEAFIRFMVFNLNHMAKEENILNKILWRYYSDEEIKAVAGQIGKADPPWIQEFYVTWMLRGINNTEAINWMKAIEKGTPAVVFQTLLQKAEQELPGKRFQTITQSLSEGVQVA
jgi:hemerythrin-like domain-containing protein